MLPSFHHFASRIVILATLTVFTFYVHAQTPQSTNNEMISQLIVKLKPENPATDKVEPQSRALTSEAPSARLGQMQDVISRVLQQRAQQKTKTLQKNRLLKNTNNTGADVAENMRAERAIDNTTMVLSVGKQISRSEAEQLMKDIAKDDAVEYVEPDVRVHHFLTPNDYSYQEQWDYTNGIGGANLPPAWDQTQGSEKIVVAVIDTGYLPHADLEGNLLLPGYNFISNPAVANGINRGPDSRDPGDWITQEENSDPRSPFYQRGAHNSSWHGSHVAGTVGAVTNNGIGVSGISWKGKILPVRVLGKGGGALSDVITGMRWAAGLPVYDTNGQLMPVNTHPAQVLNLSLGVGNVSSCWKSFTDAINVIKQKGAVIVVAAGNDGKDAATSLPANCDGVIVVGATDSNGKQPYFSNYGPKVTISAPGVNILSTVDSGKQRPLREESGQNGDSYSFYNGTSMAAPHVAGTIALMLAIDPTLTSDKIVELLKASARKFPEGSNCTPIKCGAGLLDAGRAVELVKQGGI